MHCCGSSVLVDQPLSGQAAEDADKPQHSTPYNGIMGETVNAIKGLHEGLVGAVLKVDPNEALIAPYPNGDNVTVPNSILQTEGIVMDVNDVPAAFYTDTEFKSEALAEYISTRPLLIDHHNQIDVILKWLQDFDQAQNIKKLTLANFAHFLCRSRDTEGVQGQVASPKAVVFPSYLNDDGSQTHEAQHPGIFDHLDLINICSNLHTLVVDLDYSAFWEPSEQDTDMLASPIAPTLRSVDQIVSSYGLNSFLRLLALRILHIDGLLWKTMYDDPQEDARIKAVCFRIRGELVEWLDENKPEHLEVKVCTDGEDGEDEDGITWGARDGGSRNRRTRRFGRTSGPGWARIYIPGFY